MALMSKIVKITYVLNLHVEVDHSVSLVLLNAITKFTALIDIDKTRG